MLLIEILNNLSGSSKKSFLEGLLTKITSLSDDDFNTVFSNVAPDQRIKEPFGITHAGNHELAHDQDQVGAAFDQTAGGLGVVLDQLVKGDVAITGVVDVR